MHRAGRTSLLGGAVVGQEHQNSVVQFPHGPKPIDEPADLVVGVIQERGERLLKPARETLLVLPQVIPGLDAGVAGRKGGIGVDHAELDLALEPALTHQVPALVVVPAVLVEVFPRCLVRRVRRSERQVSEERTIGAEPLVVVDHHQ